MLRSRKPLAAAAVLAVFSLGLLVMLRVRPLPYLSDGSVVLDDGVPEMQVGPVVACPPVLVQGVLQGRTGPPRPPADRLATVYVITPTYPRAVQVPEMTRLAQTLMLASNVFWVVTEDAVERTPAVTEILQRSGLPHVHILGLKPEKFTKKAGFKGPVPRGVSNRMAALEWLRQNAQDGVFYFADDDNTYDYRLFAELARTRRASAFPVGLVTQHGLSTPVVRDGAVVDFYDGWIGGRTFPMDMAGFAVSVPLLLQHPKAAMPFTAGYEEDGFLKSLGLKKEDLEPLADNCTKILVWHTQTKQPRVPFSTVDANKYRGTNLEVLRHIVNPSSSPRPRTRPRSSATGAPAPRTTPGRSSAALPTPGRSSAALPTPGRSSAALPTPGRSSTALPTPGRSSAALSAPSRPSAALPTPGRSSAALPTSGRSSAALPTPGRSSAALSTPGRSSAAAPSSFAANSRRPAAINATVSHPRSTIVTNSLSIRSDTAVRNLLPTWDTTVVKDSLLTRGNEIMRKPLPVLGNKTARNPPPSRGDLVIQQLFHTTSRTVATSERPITKSVAGRIPSDVLDIIERRPVPNVDATQWQQLPVLGNVSSKRMDRLRDSSPSIQPSLADYRSAGIPPSAQRFLDLRRPTAPSQRTSHSHLQPLPARSLSSRSQLRSSHPRFRFTRPAPYRHFPPLVHGPVPQFSRLPSVSPSQAPLSPLSASADLRSPL